MEGKKIASVLVVLIIVGMAIYWFSSKKTTPKTDDKPKPDDKPKDKLKPDDKPKPKTETEAKCGKLKYERAANDPEFKMLDKYELVKNPDSFLIKMYAEGHSNDFISFAAAFLKGMNLELSIAMVKKYNKSILDFKENGDISRKSDFFDEVQQQMIDRGSLICEKKALVALVGFFK